MSDESTPPPHAPEEYAVSGGGRRGRATRPMHRDRPCMNCGDPTPGEFCPTCGQRKVVVQVSVVTLVMDVLEDQFILDRRLPRTLWALLFRPGRLTVEHVNGRIVRYIHPFRLYLVTSLLFFLLLSFFSVQLVRRTMDGGVEAALAGDGTAAVDSALAEVRQELGDSAELSAEDRAELEAMEAALLSQRRETRVDSLATRIAELEAALGTLDQSLADSTIPGPVRQALRFNRAGIERQREVAAAQREELVARADSVDAPADEERTVGEMFEINNDSVSVGIGVAPVDSAFAGQVERLKGMTPREALETLVGTFFNYVPTLMFILLPAFAAVLKLLYIRRGRYYAEHFVFLLHVHSVVFILATVMLLIRRLVPAWVEGLLVLWILVYILIAMKRVYGQGWLKTFLKYWTLGWAYFWILLSSLPLAIMATLLLF